MNLAPYCSVADACRIAGVSKGYMCRMIREGKIEAVKMGSAYLVVRASVEKFERQPGMGRPRKDVGKGVPNKGGRSQGRRKPAK